MSSRLNFVVLYSIQEDIPPTIWSDIKPEHWSEVLEGFLSTQVGAGEDTTPRVDRDVYRIHLQLDLEEDDTFYCDHDCGNKGLRTGILMDVLAKVGSGTYKVVAKFPAKTAG
jgi:hypothetical protein